MSILEKLRDLHEKATPEPWRIDKEDVGDEDFIYIPTGIIGGNGKRVVGSVGGLCSEDCDLGEGELEANAELITLLRNNLPALLEVVEAAKAYTSPYYSGEEAHIEEAGVRLKTALAALSKVEADDDSQT